MDLTYRTNARLRWEVPKHALSVSFNVRGLPATGQSVAAAIKVVMPRATGRTCRTTSALAPAFARLATADDVVCWHARCSATTCQRKDPAHSSRSSWAGLPMTRVVVTSLEVGKRHELRTPSGASRGRRWEWRSRCRAGSSTQLSNNSGRSKRFDVTWARRCMAWRRRMLVQCFSATTTSR